MGRHTRTTRKRKKRVKIHWGRFLLSLLVLGGIIFAGILFWPLPAKAEPQIFDEDPLGQEEVVPEPVHLSIRAVGDVMCHPAQYQSAYNSSTGQYDFSGNYTYIKKYIQDADLALCNVETTFKGDGNYVGYPIFNSPDSLATAIRQAGFDVAWFANNHMIDTGKTGVLRTVELMRGEGMTVAGARLTDFCGVKSGRDTDKLENCSLGLVPGTEVGTSAIEQCPLSLECRVRQKIDMGSHTAFIAEIVAVQADERYIDSKGKLNLNQAGMLAYLHGEYFATGRKCGSFGFSVKKRRK